MVAALVFFVSLRYCHTKYIRTLFPIEVVTVLEGKHKYLENQQNIRT